LSKPQLKPVLSSIPKQQSNTAACVTGVLQGCYKSVTRVLQECYRGVMMDSRALSIF
jgi:hypothetical protein